MQFYISGKHGMNGWIFCLSIPGQIIIFHQPRFPSNSRGFPFPNATFPGKKYTRVFGRCNLTRFDLVNSPALPEHTRKRSHKMNINNTSCALKARQQLQPCTKQQQDVETTTRLHPLANSWGARIARIHIIFWHLLTNFLFVISSGICHQSASPSFKKQLLFVSNMCLLLVSFFTQDHTHLCAEKKIHIYISFI